MRLTGQSYKKINGSVSKLKVCIKHGTPTWHHLLFKPTRILTEPESLDVGFVSWKEKGERPECYIPIGPCLVISSPQSSCKDHHPFQRPYGYSSMSNLSLIYSFIHSFNKQSFRVRLEATYSFWSGSFLHLQSQQWQLSPFHISLTTLSFVSFFTFMDSYYHIEPIWIIQDISLSLIQLISILDCIWNL